MIEMTLTAFKLGMGDEVWTKKEFFLQKYFCLPTEKIRILTLDPLPSYKFVILLVSYKE